MIELVVFGVCALCTVLSLGKWYRPLFSLWPPGRAPGARWVLGLLPVVALGLVFATLRYLAAFDVVGDIVFLLFYLLLGCTWLWVGTIMLAKLFDLSRIDDVLQLNNKAALAAFTGGFLGLTLIYSGANVGDGPGWWCVVFAGGLGLVAWFVLGLFVNRCTGLFERITVERNTGSGIRAGFYLLSGGILLARACAGDWTSFYMTVVEFLDGWPILVLTGIAILVELILSRAERDASRRHVLPSIVVGLLFVALSVLSVLVLPQLRENPLYGAVGRMWGLPV